MISSNQQNSGQLRRYPPKGGEPAWRRMYGTSAWLGLRADQLRKTPLCERCLARGTRTSATDVHHKIRHNGDSHLFFRGPLASSCKPCHDLYEKQIETYGYSQEIGVDGLPLDSNHPFNKE